MAHSKEGASLFRLIFPSRFPPVFVKVFDGHSESSTCGLPNDSTMLYREFPSAAT